MQRNRILIIDDEDHIREIAALSFELTDRWDVTAVSSGIAGISAAIGGRPDLILLDVMMPELDGPATFRQLQSDVRTRDVPVIFLTAKVRNADISRYLGLGVYGVISKPFDPLRLPEEAEALMSAGNRQPS